MLRVRILTYHFSDNFGALIQAYALRKWFLRHEIDAEFINYHPRYVERGGNFDKPLNPLKWRKNLVILYLRLSHIRRRLFGDPDQDRGLELFRREQLGVKCPRLKTVDELSALAPCDMLVCGSDQIWNPSVQHGLDPVYFLLFDSADKPRRISYAASFGKSSLDPMFHKEVRLLLSKLDGISVREKSGIEIVHTVAGRDAVAVPDPTILLGDFSELLRNTAKYPVGHVFCYALRTGEVIGEVARCVGKLLQTDILSPQNTHRRWAEIGKTIYPTPIEWLAYIHNAKIVVSNSFHGVALSIILQKPFIAVALPGSKKALNERIWNLLDEVNLRDRLVETADETKIEQVMGQSIDWGNTETQLIKLRRSGSEFLERELSKLQFYKDHEFRFHRT